QDFTIDGWVSGLQSYFYSGTGEDIIEPDPDNGVAGDTNADRARKQGIIPTAVDRQLNFLTSEEGSFELDPTIKQLGWGGAGVWFNSVAQMNGALVTALHGMPRIDRYPEVMEIVRKNKLESDENPSPRDLFTPSFSRIDDPLLGIPYAKDIAITLNQPYLFWIENKPAEQLSGNFFVDAMNVVLGTKGLFDMCKNAMAHPLAQLSAVGRSMIESSISAAGFTVLFSVLGVASSSVSSVTFAASQFFGAITSVGLLIGFMLFYVIPFMPFLYFFFAVGGWVKSIFEAMVAVPLWALAHLRIDSDSIPGEAGLQGYYLLFEIFVRPILIVFGLIAAITIFAALVRVMNEIFYLAVSNLSGFDTSTSSFCGRGDAINPPQGSAAWARGPIDEFAFTMLYAVLAYMIGMACFKLIDMIPNQILRWVSAEISGFNDGNQDAAGGLLTYISLAGNQFGSQIGGGLSNLGQSFQNRGR
ncbi:MAG: DotA/TraY family protein, partial [Pseudomonadota bacterium]